MGGRRISLELKPELSRFLNQERSRLMTQYGVKVSNHDIVRTLLEQHRLRVMNAAKEDESLLWYYHRLEDLEIDASTATTTTTKSTASTTRKGPGRPPREW